MWLRFARRSGYVQETTTAQRGHGYCNRREREDWRRGRAGDALTHPWTNFSPRGGDHGITQQRFTIERQSRAEHLDKLLDEALEQTFPASDPVAIDFERSGDSSGRDSAVEPDQSGRMRQQSVEKTPGAASIALPREQRPARGAVVDATLMTCASALWQDRDMALAQR